MDAASKHKIAMHRLEQDLAHARQQHQEDTARESEAAAKRVTVSSPSAALPACYSVLQPLTLTFSKSLLGG